MCTNMKKTCNLLSLDVHKQTSTSSNLLGAYFVHSYGGIMSTGLWLIAGKRALFD